MSNTSLIGKQDLPTELVEALHGSDDMLKDLIEFFYNELMELERDEHVDADRYERSDERTTQRNGYRKRGLTTRLGRLELRVPRTRDGEFSPSIFERYERSEKALVLALQMMYIKGVSTRKVKGITEKLCGIEFSKDQVSHLAKKLDEGLEKWRTRPLDMKYPYLIIDAREEKVRRDHEVVSQGVLIVKGINEEGYRDIIGVVVADTESKQTYTSLFKSLKERGLHGVRYIVSDAHEGLKATIESEFQQTVVWQRCQVHLRRNALDKVHRKNKKALNQWLDSIFEQPTRQAAHDQLGRCVEMLEEKFPKVAAWLDENLRAGLNIYALPPSHRTRMRSTNGLERVNQELKRRTKVVRIFPNRKSCLRLITALCQETAEEWLTNPRYCDMSAWNKFDGNLLEWKEEQPPASLIPSPGEQKEKVAAGN